MSIYSSTSKVAPLLETIFLNKGGEPDQWKAVMRQINDKTEE